MSIPVPITRGNQAGDLLLSISSTQPSLSRTDTTSAQESFATYLSKPEQVPEKETATLPKAGAEEETEFSDKAQLKENPEQDKNISEEQIAREEFRVTQITDSAMQAGLTTLEKALAVKKNSEEPGKAQTKNLKKPVAGLVKTGHTASGETDPAQITKKIIMNAAHPTVLSEKALLNKENTLQEIKRLQQERNTNIAGLDGSSRTESQMTKTDAMALMALLNGKPAKKQESGKEKPQEKRFGEISRAGKKVSSRNNDTTKMNHTLGTENVSRETIPENSSVGLPNLKPVFSGLKQSDIFALPENSPVSTLGRNKPDFMSQLTFQNGMTLTEKTNAMEFIKTQATLLPPEVREQLQSLLERARMQVSNDKNARLNLRLNPEEYGTVDLRMKLSDGILSGKIIVDSESVRNALQEFLEKTLQDFRNNGFQVSGLDVEVRQNDSFDKNAQNTGNREAPSVKAGDYEAKPLKAKAGEGLYA